MPDPFGGDNCGPDYAPHMHKEPDPEAVKAAVQAFDAITETRERCPATHPTSRMRCERPVHKDPQHIIGIQTGGVPWTDEPRTFAGAEHIMQFFDTSHLSGELASVSRMFGDLAQWVVETIPRNPERSAALRKILEAKDAAVRAKIAKDLQPLPAAIPLPADYEPPIGHGG